MLAGERFEIVAIVNGVLVTYAEKQRQLLGVRMRQVVGRHGAEGRDAGAGGDEDGFLGGIANHEEAQRRGRLDRIARFHGEKMRSEHASVHQIQAELEAIAVGQRDDGIRPRDLLAAHRFIERNELAWLEMELLYFGDFERRSGGLRAQCRETREPWPSCSVQCFTRAIEQRLHQRGMAIERRGDSHFDIAVRVRGVARQTRQIALHVRPERQEIGDHDDALQRRAR